MGYIAVEEKWRRWVLQVVQEHDLDLQNSKPVKPFSRRQKIRIRIHIKISSLSFELWVWESYSH